MLVFSRTITPKPGHEDELAAAVAMMPQHAETLGLPTVAYRSVGSGVPGRIRFAGVAPGLAELVAAQGRQPPEVTAAVDALRREHNVTAQDQILRLVTMSPAAAPAPAPLLYGVIARIDRTHVHAAIANNAAFSERCVALGASYGFALFPLTGPSAELHLVLGFDTPARFDEWVGLLVGDEQAQAILRQGTGFTSWAHNDDYIGELWARLG
ncbi:MAG: hypothetical protein R2749_28990 [Acidimicrobiales bacterium]